MSLIILLTISVLAWHGSVAIARLAVDAIATVVGLALFARAAHVSSHILAMRNRHGAVDFDRRLGRSDRRLIAAGLKLAIQQTEFRSLFPQTASRCERLLGIAAPSLGFCGPGRADNLVPERVEPPL